MKIKVTVFKKQTSIAEIVVELQEGETLQNARERVLESCVEDSYDSLFRPIQQIQPEYDYDAHGNGEVDNDTALSVMDSEMVVNHSYTVFNEKIVPPDQDVFRQVRKAKLDFERIERTYAGASIALFLKNNPSVKEVDLTFSAEHDRQFGDKGNTGRSVYVDVDNLLVKTNEGQVNHLFSGEDIEEDGSAEEIIKDHFNDDAEALYECFISDETSIEKVEICIERKMVEHLLGEETISGKEVFELLFPERSN